MKRLTQFLNLKADHTCEERFNFVVKSIREYYEDVYFDDCHENIFKVNEAGDFSALMHIYGIEGALKIAEKNLRGYVIAGHNIPLDKVINVTMTNYWSIYMDMFAQEILDRILNLNKDGIGIEQIQKYYQSVDVERLLNDDKCYIVVTMLRFVENAFSICSVERVEEDFASRQDAKDYIFDHMTALLRTGDDKCMIISSAASGKYEFHDVNKKEVLMFRIEK